MIPGPPVPFPSRDRDAHKFACGDVLVIAGSRGMTGAAYLTGKAALRSGAGLVTLACPASVEQVLEVKTTCVMTRGLPDSDAGALAEGALEPLRGLCAGRDALALGPGLSRADATAQVIRTLVAELPADGPPLVLDADGLNAFEGRAAELAAAPARARLVLTPHPGELRRVSGCSREDLGERRAETLRAFVEATGVTTLLKGRRTIVAAPGREPYANTTGNPGMATAGAGDVLTGIIAGLLAQGLEPFDAARLGAHVHGLAGDAAARRRGWAALIASDLLDGLCEVLPALEPRS